MQLLGEIYSINLALLPISSVFVMDPVQAAYSLRLLKPRTAVPIHYATFPILTQSANDFVQLAQIKAPEVNVIVLSPGEEITL